MSRLLPFGLLAALGLLSSAAHAQLDVRALSRAFSEAGSAPAAQQSGALRGARRISAVVRLDGVTDPRSLGISPVARGWGVIRGSLERLNELAIRHPGLRLEWSPPRRPLLDRAGQWTGAARVRNETGLTGQGTIVGIVDTGVDLLHEDLRRPDGSTRVAWLLDFTREPRGVHLDIEARCSEGALMCAAFSADDLDALIAAGDVSALPGDDFGHGTHIASLAAGNGGAPGAAGLVGVAPEAGLIVARVSSGAAAVEDTDVLKAVELIFYLAEGHRQMQGLSPLPAVVNLSLGSDFGPHDGTALISETLAEMVGDEHPGRAIVVAAGNSAGVLRNVRTFPEPLGVHTEVHVPRRSSVRVPVLTPPPPFEAEATRAAVFLWLDFQPDDRVSVGFDSPVIAPLDPGDARTVDDGPLSVTIINGSVDEFGLLAGGRQAAAVVIEGQWPPGQTFALRLEGEGTANIWVQSEGDLGPARGSIGALLPAATKEATVTIPASHPELIAVGATINRLSWTDREDRSISVERFGASDDLLPDSTAFFSSSGPNTLGGMKPELVAPGAFVAGALSRGADPADNAFSVFAAGVGCRPSPGCAILDDRHAITTGTSMASPIVAGAIAVLFERDPALTQGQLRRLLQAGARRIEGSAVVEQQLGAGALDLPGALDVMGALEEAVLREPAAEKSWLATASPHVRPDGRSPLVGIVQLRDSEARVADGFDEGDLTLTVAPGSLERPLEKTAPGLWHFHAVAPRGSGGDAMQIDVLYRGTLLLQKRVPIAVDSTVARSGFFAQGGCAVARGGRPPAPGLVLAWLLALTAWRGRRCSRGARRAKNPGRRGKSGSDPRR